MPRQTGRGNKRLERSWHRAYRDVMGKVLDLESQKLGLGPDSPIYDVHPFWPKNPFTHKEYTAHEL